MSYARLQRCVLGGTVYTPADDAYMLRILLHRGTCACVVFALFATRIALPYCWEPWLYYPVMSPLYRQQEHWLETSSITLAVGAHVGSGVTMLLAIVLQLDAPTRHRLPALHRWVGRLYILAGVVAISSLRWLRASSGAGSSKHGDPLMRGFIDASSGAWLVATAFALDAITRRRDKAAHSRCMLLSASLAALPILQRLLNALLLCPCAAAAKEPR